MRVSTLCLGAMTFGEADAKSFMHKVGSDRDESFRMLDRSLAAVNTGERVDVAVRDLQSLHCNRSAAHCEAFDPVAQQGPPGAVAVTQHVLGATPETSPGSSARTV